MKTLATKIIIFLSPLQGLPAYGAIFGTLLACGLGIPIPEDITLIAAGILAGLGNIDLFWAICVGFIGVMAGDAFLFFLGHFLGRRAFEVRVIKKFMTKKRIEMAEKKIKGNSRFICFIARFLPGLRSPIFLTAGVLGVKPIVFFTLDGLAALISVPFWVVVGWYFAHNLEDALAFAKKAQEFIIIGMILMVVGYIWLKRKL